MAVCDTCGNDYDKPFVVMSGSSFPSASIPAIAIAGFGYCLPASDSPNSLRPSRPIAQLTPAAAGEHREIGLGERVAQEQFGVQGLRIAALALPEGHDHVGVTLLWADELRGILFAAIELGQHLVGRVAALGAVALHLPLAPQLLGRREVHA